MESRDISPGDDFPLHQGVFNGDTKLVSQLIRVHDVAQKDVHGNIYLLPASLTNRESFLLTIDFSLLIHGAFSQIKQ